MKKSRKKRLQALVDSQPREPFFRVPLPVLLLTCLIALVIYSPALGGPFVWDDELLIQNNPHVTTFDHAYLLFTEDVEATAGQKSSLYRPLMMTTFAVEYGLWRLHPVGYHVMNVVWHAAVVLMVYCFAFLLFGSAVPAFLASVLFLVHPVHTEAVSYISGRSDPMSVLFLLGVFFLYIKRPFSAAVNFFAMTTLYAACLLSRESGLILPALILLYHGAFKKRVDRLNFGGLLAVTAAYVVLRLTALGFLMPHTVTGKGTVLSRLPGFFAAFVQYLRLLVWPADLHMEYGTVFLRLTDPLALAGLVLFAAVCGLLVYAWRRSRLTAFGIGWFLLGLLPFSNIFPINAYMAEHWLYLPSIGLFLIAGHALYNLYQRPLLKNWGLGLAAALVGFYGTATFIQNKYWGDPIYFYERTFAYAPFSWRVANNLGTTYQEKKELEKAEVYLLKAVALKPDSVEAHNNLGIVYSLQGKFEEAFAQLNEALALDPRYTDAYRNLGNTYWRAGRPEEAAQAYEKALSLRPDYALAYAGLGNLAQDAERYDEAVRLYEKALEIDPTCVEAYNNLGAVKQKAGEGKALEYYRQAIDKEPDNPDAYANLALAHQQLGQYEEAMAVYEKLFKLSPRHAAGHNNQGSLFQTLGRTEDAIASYEKAIAYDPKNADAYFNLGNVYRQTGRLEEAIGMYEKAAEFAADPVDALINLGAVYQMAGRVEDAIETYKRALESNPASLEAVMNLALVFQNKGDTAEAESYYEKAITLDPGNASVYNNIGMMWQAQKDLVRAEAMYRKAIEVNPAYAESYNNLAVLCMMSGRRQEAFDALKKSVEADPSYGQGYHNLAIYCYGERDYAEALRYFEKAKALGFKVDPRLEQDLAVATGQAAGGETPSAGETP